MCFLVRGTHITRDVCVLGRGAHIIRHMCFLCREHLSLGICGSWLGTLDSVIGLPNIYTLDSDLSGGYRYPSLVLSVAHSLDRRVTILPRLSVLNLKGPKRLKHP